MIMNEYRFNEWMRWYYIIKMLMSMIELMNMNKCINESMKGSCGVV